MANEDQQKDQISAENAENSTSLSSSSTSSPANADTSTVAVTASPTESGSNGAPELIISNKAYLKVVMHGLRYPHATVNGVLLAKQNNKGKKRQTIVDAIPLFHSGHGLTPMVEVALTQISEYLSHSTDTTICGYYQINENFHEYPHPVPPMFAEKIAERIYENNPDSVLFMISNYELSRCLDDEECLQAPFFLFHYQNGKWALKDGKSKHFRLENNTTLADAIQRLIFAKRQHLNLIDFDQHLECPKADWRNPYIDSAIDAVQERFSH